MFLSIDWSAGAAANQSDDWALPRLMEEMANVSSSTARFTEERYLSYLSEPVRSEGVLYYRAPSHLEKRTLKPLEERVIIDGDRLVIEKPGGEQIASVLISDFPALQTLITGIHMVLAGKLDALRKSYLVDYSYKNRDWLLSLVPKDDAVRRVVEVILIRGVEIRIVVVEIKETNGTRTVMHVAGEP